MKTLLSLLVLVFLFNTLAAQSDTTKQRTEEQRQKDEKAYKQKHEDFDRMIDKYRRKAERMERINPRTAEYPVLTVQEVEDIEKDLPVGDFTDDDIQKIIKKKKLDVKIEERMVEINKLKAKRAP